MIYLSILFEKKKFCKPKIFIKELKRGGFSQNFKLILFTLTKNKNICFLIKELNTIIYLFIYF